MDSKMTNEELHMMYKEQMTKAMDDCTTLQDFVSRARYLSERLIDLRKLFLDFNIAELYLERKNFIQSIHDVQKRIDLYGRVFGD